MEILIQILALVATFLSLFIIPALIYIIKIGNTVQDMKPKFDKHLEESSNIHTMISVNSTKIDNIEKRIDHAGINGHHDFHDEHRR